MRLVLATRNYSLLGAVLVAAVLVGCDKRDDKAKTEATPPPAPPASKSTPPPAPKPAPAPQQSAPPAPAPAPQVAPPPPPPPAVAPPPPQYAPPPPRYDPPPKPGPAPVAPDRRGGKWELLGERQADLKLDRDRIVVGRAEGKFRELQLTVRGAPLEVYDMVVTFGNGQQFKPTLRFHFDERTSSRVIDLPGDLRTIKQVDFVYRTSARREGRATIALYGR